MSEEKKNLAENKLSDEQLDQVSGGRGYQRDSRITLKNLTEQEKLDKKLPTNRGFFKK